MLLEICFRCTKHRAESCQYLHVPDHNWHADESTEDMPNSNQTDLARVVRELFETPELPSLGPKRRPAILPVRELLDRLNSSLHQSPIHERNRQLVRSVLLLWHDHLDESHSISQGIDDSDGSFVHGIMHRREPDYGNSSYWFRRVGNHSCFPTICTRARTVLSPAHSNLADKLLVNGAWDPGARQKSYLASELLILRRPCSIRSEEFRECSRIHRNLGS